MKKYIGRVKRGFVRETLCINKTLVLVLAVVCACLGLVFAIGGVDYEVYGEIAQPKFYFPPFVMIILQMIFYALLGAAAGVAVSSPYCRRGAGKACRARAFRLHSFPLLYLDTACVHGGFLLHRVFRLPYSACFLRGYLPSLL